MDPDPPLSPTLPAQFQAWLAGPTFADRPFSAGTVRRYGRSARYFLTACHASQLRSLDEANTAWLRAWLYSTKADGRLRYATSTRVVMQAALNLLFIWAGRHGYARANPVEQLARERATDRRVLGRGGRKAKRLPKVLSWEEQDQLLAIVQTNPRAFTAARDGALVALALFTGLRREELCSLQAKCLDLLNGQLRVIGKGNRERQVRFARAEVWPLVESWLGVRQARGWHNEGAFLRTASGQAMTPNLVYQQVSGYLTRLEAARGCILPAKGPHLLRHTSASAQLAKGVPVTQVQANLGHESLMTLQIYAHLLPPRLASHPHW